MKKRCSMLNYVILNSLQMMEELKANELSITGW